MPLETRIAANAISSQDAIVDYMRTVFAPVPERAGAYRPRITRLPSEDPLGGAEYRMDAGDDIYGGEKSVYVRLTANELVNPDRARLAFRGAYLELLGRIEQAVRQKAYIDSGNDPLRD